MNKMGVFDLYDENGKASSKEPHHIKGIRCDVKNCAYHDGELFCTADKVSIGPSFANSCADTVCATFKEKTRL
ncbi:MAG: DUF1540 domain-containing protein [Ruminococcaceae bacterium]|nr:DUF1540 domain-containing protein [Oscillospiraceae bacterium]